MVVDFHVHYFPDNIVEKAISLLAAPNNMKPYTDGTLNGLKKSMTEAGIDISLNLPLATSADSVRGINKWASIHNVAPVYSLGSIHPDTPDPGNAIPWIKSLGLKGVKMHPEYQTFNPLEKRLEKIWQACSDNDIFVMTHAGKDINFSPPPLSCPADFAELHRRFPKLTLVVAHLGSWELWNEVEEKLAGLPVYLDLAFVLGILENDKIVSIIRKHGADRILFGTDSPWRDQKAELETFRKLPLTDDEKDLILYKNALRLLKW
ncbi:MAG: hypothetical protein A2017_21620 [Lentisphaerae bacterium GWF2_44_16]|nr:MAG: hypothetical protein A2017_21620 [Lentisphaerae bacterium GWF2_44_16]